MSTVIWIKFWHLDSITLALTKPLAQLVKPEFKEKWDNQLYPKWFVQDAKNIDQAREPGLFKEEVNVISGGMVALRNSLQMHVLYLSSVFINNSYLLMKQSFYEAIHLNHETIL